jgi:hypothetical protein
VEDIFEQVLEQTKRKFDEADS